MSSDGSLQRFGLCRTPIGRRLGVECGGRAPRAQHARRRGRARGRGGWRRPRGSRASARRTRVAATWAWRSISRSVTRSRRSVCRRSNSSSVSSSRAARIGLGLLDPLGDRGLPRAQALGDLLDRPPPLDRLRLELVERLRHRRRRGPLQLLPQPDHGLPLLVARRAELGRLALDASPPRRRSPAAGAGSAAPSCASRWRSARSRSSAIPCSRSSSRRSVAASVSARASLGAPLALGEGGAPLCSTSRRSSAASWDIVSARSRASVRRSLIGVRGSLLGDHRVHGRPRGGDQCVGVGSARTGPPEREPEAGSPPPRRRRGTQRGSRRPRGHAIRPLLEVGRGERGGDEHGGEREQPQRRLGRGDERLACERLTPAAGAARAHPRPRRPHDGLFAPESRGGAARVRGRSPTPRRAAR